MKPAKRVPFFSALAAWMKLPNSSIHNAPFPGVGLRRTPGERLIHFPPAFLPALFRSAVKT